WFNVVDVNWPLAAVEAIVLLALALSALALFDLAARSLRAMRPTGAPRPRRDSPGGGIDGALRIVLFAVLAFILSPLVFVVINSLNGSAFNSFPPEGFSLQWYWFVLGYGPFRDGIVNSLVIATASSLPRSSHSSRPTVRPRPRSSSCARRTRRCRCRCSCISSSTRTPLSQPYRRC